MLEKDFGNQKNVQAEKWGLALDAGFQVIPNVLIKAQTHLGLDPTDIVIILNLNLHWWNKSGLPYPPPALIANRMGVSRRTVERRIVHLQKLGLLRRLAAAGVKGQPKIRKYDLSGLVDRLQDAALIGLNQRAHKANDLPRKSQPGNSKRSARQSPLILGNG